MQGAISALKFFRPLLELTVTDMGKVDECVLSHVNERDIDLLLIDELRCNSDFSTWFIVRVLGNRTLKAEPLSLSVRHSVHSTGEGGGESDIEIRLDLDAKQILLLVEDKIHSPFTLRQAERYRERAQRAMREGAVDACLTVLIAPAAYLACVPNTFDRAISYEDVRAFFAGRVGDADPERGARARHRLSILDQAILRQRRGYVAAPDPVVSGVWSYYEKLAQAAYPDLRMVCKNTNKPGDSYTVSFDCLSRQAGLPKCRIEHVMQPAKQSAGYVHILLLGQGLRLAELAGNLKGVLPADAVLAKAGKSAAIRIAVPAINRFETGLSQDAALRIALDTARRLKLWWQSNAKLMR